MAGLYTAGEFCCSSEACVGIWDSDSETWEKIPHATEITHNEQAQSNGLVTSSTGGQEQAMCGPITTTGTLGIACHDGFGPGLLCVNTNYNLRWASDCALIFDGDGDAISPSAGTYWEAQVKITGNPINYNISQGGTPIYVYPWRLVRWIAKPTCQTETEST